MSKSRTKEDATAAVGLWLLNNLPTQDLSYLPANWHADFVAGLRLMLHYQISPTVEATLFLSIGAPPTINWPGTSYSITNAFACLALYRRLAEFAAQLDSKRSDELARVRLDG